MLKSSYKEGKIGLRHIPGRGALTVSQVVSVSIGIIGLKMSGRTTIFSALTGASVSRDGSQAHAGITTVPDPRLKILAGMFKRQRVVPAEIMFSDIGASVKSLTEGKGATGQLLSELGKVDCLLETVRAFKDESVPHPEGGIDVLRDIENMNLELAFADLAIIERRVTRMEPVLKSAKPADRPPILREQELLLRLKKGLEGDRFVRELDFTPQENRLIADYQFLTAKPLLIVVNIGEEQLGESDAVKGELSSRYARKNCLITVMCGKLEAELAQLGEETVSLREGYGIKESGRDNVVKLAYELLGLISFLTIGTDEVKAWSVPQGTVAQRAAGKVHSDMERGFIRAEVISYEDLVTSGSLAEGRRRGLLRLEGKNYVVKDGDVINYLFNV